MKLHERVTVLLVCMTGLFVSVFGQDSDETPVESTVDAATVRRSGHDEASPAHPSGKPKIIREVHREVHEKCCEDFERRTEIRRPGAGIIAPQIVWFETGPLEQLAQKQGDLRQRRFRFNDNPVFMLGFMGYHDIGNGVRTGLGGWGGYKPFQSEDYGTRGDSVMILRTIPVYGGFLLEKAFLFPGFDFYAGGMIGGGALIVHKKAYDIAGGDAFVSAPSDSEDTYHYGSVTAAGYLMWDVHGGLTFSLAPLFHVGVEATMVVTYSPEGFGVLVGDYLTASPGVRLRFAFGRGR